MWRRRVCRPATSIPSIRNCRCRDPSRSITTMYRTCRSLRNRRRCHPHRARRPKSPAATSRSIPTARTASPAPTRPRTRRITSPRRASDCQSWRLGTSPGRRWTRAAPCWYFRTPGSQCRCRRAPFPSRSGRNSIWRCSTRIVTGPDCPVSANYSCGVARVTRRRSRCQALRSQLRAFRVYIRDVRNNAMLFLYQCRSARAYIPCAFHVRYRPASHRFFCVAKNEDKIVYGKKKRFNNLW